MSNIFTCEKLKQIKKNYLERKVSFGKKECEIDAVMEQLSEDEKACVQFCYTYMPVQDVVSYPPQLILENAKHSVMLFYTAPWVKKLPIDIFLNFVLFYRVNNEYLESYKKQFFDEIFPRIEHLDSKNAALEVNYWCCEKATYKATDDRTASPLTVLKRTYGRCGEESTLLVSTLRSVGLPARQCYTPVWAHCDDNHAWVEVYAEGNWYYMGACEPEPILNKGWFTAAASKAILVHSKAFNSGIDGEIVAYKTPVFCTVNNTKSYGKTKKIKVNVIKNNKPLPNAIVRFEIVNYSELSILSQSVTDENGSAEFLAGMGDIYVHVHDNESFASGIIDTRKADSLTIDFDHARKSGNMVEDFELVPPAEDLSSQEKITNEMAKLHEEKFKSCNDIRRATEESFLQSNSVKDFIAPLGADETLINRYFEYAKGNAGEIIKFINLHDISVGDKMDILSTLREKDFVDITADILAEYVHCSNAYRDIYPHDIFVNCILAPRIENEMILPQRKAIAQFFNAMEEQILTPLQLWDYLEKNILLQDMYSYGSLICDAKESLKYSLSDTRSMNIVFVAAARALGMAARLNSVTGKKEFYQDGQFLAISSGEEKAKNNDATITINNKSNKSLVYFTEISIAALENGVFNSLVLWDNVVDKQFSIKVQSGYYRVITTVRQIDGSVRCKAYYIDVKENAETVLDVDILENEIKSKLKYAKIGDISAQTHLGEKTSLYSLLQHSHSVIAFTEPGKEPTEHLFNELIDLQARYNEGDVDLIIAVQDPSDFNNKTLKKVVSSIAKTKLLVVNDEEYIRNLHSIMGVGDERKPFALAMNSDKLGLYAFSNYNVGTALTLLNIIGADI